jgi:hypothetical protein
VWWTTARRALPRNAQTACYHKILVNGGKEPLITLHGKKPQKSLYHSTVSGKSVKGEERPRPGGRTGKKEGKSAFPSSGSPRFRKTGKRHPGRAD